MIDEALQQRMVALVRNAPVIRPLLIPRLGEHRKASPDMLRRIREARARLGTDEACISEDKHHD